MPKTLEHALPISDAAALSLARRWKHHGSVLITGPAGAGRRSLGTSIAATRDASIPLLRADIRPGIGLPGGALLEELGIHDAREAAYTSVETLSSRLAARLGPTTILVLGAGAADERSLRTLLALARISPTIRVVLVDDERTRIAERLAGRPDSPVHLSLPAMSGEVLATTVHRLLGMTPSAYDIIALEKRSGGCFRSVCWLLDLARCNDRMVRGRGMFHMLHVDGHEVNMPSWQQRADLIGSEATSVLSLAGTLTLSTLDALGLLPDVTELEAKGDVRVMDTGVRLSSTAVRWEAAARQPMAARRLRLTKLLPLLTDKDLDVLDAVDLARWCGRSSLEAPTEVSLRAVRYAASAGDHETAVRIAEAMDAVATPEVLGDLAFSFAVLDEADAAVEATSKTIGRGGALGDLEAMGLALFIGRLRRSQDESYATAAADLLAAVRGIDPRSGIVMQGYMDLTLTAQDARSQGFDARALVAEVGDLLEHPDLAPSTRLRAQLLLALLEWLRGRPRSAIRHLEPIAVQEKADSLGASDRAIATFLHAAGAILAPDLAMTRKILESAVGDWPIPRTLRFIWVVVSLNRGETTTARLLAEPFLGPGRRERQDAVMAEISRGTAAIAAMVLQEPQLSRVVVADAQESGGTRAPTSSGIFSATLLQVRGLTAMVLDPVEHRDLAGDLFARASEEAGAVGFRALAVISAYCRARLIPPQERDEVWRWLGDRLTASDGVDGVPELYARIGRATASRDDLAIADLVTELHAAQMVQDAAALSSWLVRRRGRDLPDTARRTVARAARRGFPGRGPAERSILTPKEREISSFVLAGMTDQAIADHLGGSRRTVSTHVGRILRKLLIDSRYELTAELAAQHGIPVLDEGPGASPPL